MRARWRAAWPAWSLVVLAAMAARVAAGGRPATFPSPTPIRFEESGTARAQWIAPFALYRASTIFGPDRGALGYESTGPDEVVWFGRDGSVRRRVGPVIGVFGSRDITLPVYTRPHGHVRYDDARGLWHIDVPGPRDRHTEIQLCEDEEHAALILRATPREPAEIRLFVSGREVRRVRAPRGVEWARESIAYSADGSAVVTVRDSANSALELWPFAPDGSPRPVLAVAPDGSRGEDPIPTSSCAIPAPDGQGVLLWNPGSNRRAFVTAARGTQRLRARAGLFGTPRGWLPHSVTALLAGNDGSLVALDCAGDSVMWTVPALRHMASPWPEIATTEAGLLLAQIQCPSWSQLPRADSLTFPVFHHVLRLVDPATGAVTHHWTSAIAAHDGLRAAHLCQFDKRLWFVTDSHFGPIPLDAHSLRQPLGNPWARGDVDAPRVDGN